MQRAIEQVRLRVGRQRVALQADRLDLADECGERRAQVVRDAGDHLASVRVDRAHAFGFLAQPVERFAEGAAQAPDLVIAIGVGKEVVAQLVRAAGVADPLGGPGERGQRPGQQRDHRDGEQHADRDRHQPRGGGRANRVALEQRRHRGVDVGLPGDDVEPAARLAFVDDLVRGDQRAAPFEVRVVGDDRQRRIHLHRFGDGPEIDPVTGPERLALAGRRQHVALEVEQVQTRVRRVQRVLAKRRAEAGRVARVVAPEVGVRLEDALRERRVLRVHPVAVVLAHRGVHDDREQRGHHQAEGDDQQQDARAQRFHRRSAKRYPTPRTVSTRRGLAGSASILARRRLMCVFTVCS